MGLKKSEMFLEAVESVLFLSALRKVMKSFKRQNDKTGIGVLIKRGIL